MVKLKYFFLNGREYCTESNITLLSILNYFNYNTSLLVLEYNSLICHKKYWNQIYLKNDDKIEIITIVGGG